MNSKRSIKAKLLLIQLLAIIPLLLFIFYIFDLWTDTQRSSVLDNSIIQAKLIAYVVEKSFNTGVNITNLIANTPNIKLLQTKDLESAQNLLKTINTSEPELSGINVTDTLGRTIIHSKEITSQQKVEITLSNLDYFRQVLETKKPVVSNPTTGLFHNGQEIVMSTPIIENGKITVVVNSSFDLEFLKKKLEKVFPADDKFITLIYDQNSRLAFILHKALPDESEKALYNNLDFLNKKDRIKLNIIENQKLPASDKIFMGSSVPIDDFGWNVVNLVNQDIVFAPLYKVQKTTFIIILAAFLFAISLISYTLRKIRLIY